MPDPRVPFGHLDQGIGKYWPTRQEMTSAFRYFTCGLGYSRPMKVAAYQAPLLVAGSLEAIDLIKERIAWCESEGVSILCCPEAILGGLADYAEDPFRTGQGDGCPGRNGPLCADEQRPADKARLPRPRAGGKSLRLCQSA